MKKNIHVVGAAIIEDGKILCAQRGPSMSLPLKWEFPGGKIEPGESPEEALAREIKEEINCSIEIGEKIEIHLMNMTLGLFILLHFPAA